MPLRTTQASLLPWENCCMRSRRLSRAVFNFHYHHQRPKSHQAKALVFSRHGEPNEVLDLHTYSISPPHSTLVTLSTLSAPVNPSDYNQIQGSYATFLPFTDAIGTPEPSAVPGNEGCFEVIATGESVKTVAEGDWVIPRLPGLGTWRTHLQVDESTVMRVERGNLTHKSLATVSVNPLTAWRMLKDFVDLKEGDWFIQNGASGAVGRAVLVLAKLWGLKCIAILRDPKDTNAVLPLKNTLERLGAMKVFYESETNLPGFRDKVREVTNGQEVRLGLNSTGGEQMSKMVRVLSDGAQLVTYGNMARRPIRLGASSMIFRDIVYRGFWVSRWGATHPEEREKTIGEIIGLMRRAVPLEHWAFETHWKQDTPKKNLVNAVMSTFSLTKRTGKQIFVFPESTG